MNLRRNSYRKIYLGAVSTQYMIDITIHQENITQNHNEAPYYIHLLKSEKDTPPHPHTPGAPKTHPTQVGCFQTHYVVLQKDKLMV